jgi:hypothetical protein
VIGRRTNWQWHDSSHGWLGSSSGSETIPAMGAKGNQIVNERQAMTQAASPRQLNAWGPGDLCCEAEAPSCQASKIESEEIERDDI